MGFSGLPKNKKTPNRNGFEVSLLSLNYRFENWQSSKIAVSNAIC